MYLSDKLATLLYSTQNEQEATTDYIISLEKETNTIKIFWEDWKHNKNSTKGDYQCFTTFEAPENPTNNLDEIINQAKSLITAHNLENENDYIRTINHTR